MEPNKKYQPNIKPNIRPDLPAHNDNNGQNSRESGLDTAKNLQANENAAGTKTYGANSDGRSSSGSDNLSAVKDAENSRQGYWAGNSQKRAKQKLSLKANLKKKGPLGGLIAFIIGIPTIISIFLSPALVIQQFTASLTDEFNDQLAAMDVRSIAILKKKYSSTFTSGACSSVTIRCKYQSIRENSGLAKRLNNAGVTIEGNRSVIPGRVKPTNFVFEGKRIPADKLLTEAKTNPNLRSALRKGYDPLYAAFSDRKSTDIRTRLGLKRSSSVAPSSSTEDMDNDLKKTASGEIDIPENGERLRPIKDSEGNVTHYEGPNNKEYTIEEGERINSQIDEIAGRTELANSAGKTATKSVLKGTLTASAFGAGAADSLCTVWNMVRIAGYAAKIYQQQQLIRYSYEFVKFAHKQKYGDATAEETNYYMTKLVTNTNSEGKNALDSPGYQWAAYDDTFKPGDFSEATAGLKPGEDSTKYVNSILLQNETSRYVNGQLVSQSMMAKIAGYVTGKSSNSVAAADKSCNFIKSWKGQTVVFGLAALGAVVAVFSGGSSLSIGAIAQGAASVAMSVAFALIQPKLIDMAKGEVIQGDENSHEVGNAAVSGMGGYNAQTAQGRGLGPATESTYAAYNQLSSQVAAKYAQEERESHSPFDPSSKHTFVGSILSSITPYVAKMNNLSSTSLSLSSFVGSSVGYLTSTKSVMAAADKYSECDDPEYAELNLAADPFCNLRYAIPADELSIDPDTVLDYMINNGYITEDDPTPLGNYAEYVGKCFDRKNSIGDGQTDSNEGDGTECIIGKGGANEERNKMFRLFYLDTSIEDGMEEDFEAGVAPSTEEGNGEDLELRVATFNAGGNPKPNEDMINKMVATLKKNQPNIVGFQEFNTGWSKAVLDEGRVGTNYDMYPNGSVNGIVYNADDFEFVKGGIMPNLKYFNGTKLEAPYVLLRHKNSGSQVYVLNTHDPAKPENADLRLQNAKQHVQFIKSLDKDIPILFPGDFNSGYSLRSSGNTTAGNNPQNLTYCILTKNANLSDAFDVANNRTKKCPNPGNENTVDHIYLSDGIDVTNYFRDYGGDVHDSHYADITIPGSGSDSGEVTWPVDVKYWHANKTDFLKAHFANSGTWTNGIDSLAADIGSPPDGSAVYAMLGGTVSKSSLGGHGLAIKSKVSGGVVEIAYAHGPRENQNKSYKAGDKIMEVGCLGNCSGGHLHLDISFTPNGGDKKGVCPQDIFLALNKGDTSINWAQIAGRAAAPCGRTLN